ncbi:MAG: nucleotide exchange factor GrpE [Proteobacteria bacterium]|nr:nucleotide exchange factor GrpE [Pseudomonadota bacterium]
MTTGKKKPVQKPKPAAKKSRPVKKPANARAGQIKKHSEEIKALNDRVLRALAEVENTRRRAQREIDDTRVYSITLFAREMLTVQDNLRRALAHLPEDMKNNEAFKGFVDGVEVTERELLNIFDRHGIRKISPKGEAFDHNLHQAVFEVETGDVAPGTIVQVVQDGYVLKDRLLRPAMVGIAKAPQPKEAPQKEEKPEEGANKE